MKKNYIDEMIQQYKVKNVPYWKYYKYSHHVSWIMNAINDKNEKLQSATNQNYVIRQLKKCNQYEKLDDIPDLFDNELADSIFTQLFKELIDFDKKGRFYAPLFTWSMVAIAASAHVILPIIIRLKFVCP